MIFFFFFTMKAASLRKEEHRQKENVQFFISFLSPKHHHIYNVHPNITKHYCYIIIKKLM